MKPVLPGGSPVRTQPFPSWPVHGREEEDALLEVLRSGTWGGYSPKVREFESVIGEMHGARRAISCSNGTEALVAALRAIGLGCGDEVIVPPFTFVATATAVLLCGGSPVFVDIDPDTLNISPAAPEASATPRTRAILAVHFGGQPADLDALTAIASSRGLDLIEDAAHAHGASWRRKPVGSFGAAAAFSFQEYKLATAGEGGAVLTGSDEIAERIWSYCNQGRRKEGGWFEHFTLGTNLRLTGFQAAVLLAQLRRLPEQTRLRNANFGRFREGLRSLRGIALPGDDPRVENHPRYMTTLRHDPGCFGGASRDLLVRALRAEGIPALAAYPHPLYRNPVFSRAQLPPHGCNSWRPGQDYESLCLPESERACREGIWLDHRAFLGGAREVDDILAAFGKIQAFSSELARLEDGDCPNPVS